MTVDGGETTVCWCIESEFCQLAKKEQIFRGMPQTKWLLKTPDGTKRKALKNGLRSISKHLILQFSWGAFSSPLATILMCRTPLPPYHWHLTNKFLQGVWHLSSFWSACRSISLSYLAAYVISIQHGWHLLLNYANHTEFPKESCTTPKIKATKFKVHATIKLFTED